jgi:hypothetical protein
MKKLPAFVLVAFGACQTEPREEPAAPAAPSAAQASPLSELDRLDGRQPVPLLPMMANHQKQNMREHLEVVKEVVSATAAGDFSKVMQSARRIGYSEAMGQMCAHMGAGAPGFTEQALAFHRSADLIVDAAKREDSTGVLIALGDTLATCTACHAAYKQQIVARLSD